MILLCGMLKTLLILSLFLLANCGDQSLPTTNLAAENTQEITAREECRAVSFNHSALEHSNTISLFKCLSWHKAYPHLYNSINGIDQKEWNHLVNPLNQAIFNQEKSRLGFFSRVAALKINNGFDQLNFLLNQLGKHQPIINLLMKKVTKLNKAEIDSLFNTGKLNDERLNFILKLMVNFSKNINHQKNELMDFFKHYENDQRSLGLQREFFNALLTDLSLENIQYVLTKLKEFNKNDQSSHLFSSQKLSKLDFEKLLLITSYYPKLNNGVKYVEKYWDEHLICKNQNKIKFGIEIPAILSVFRDGDINSVFDSMIDSQSKLLIFNEICPQDNLELLDSMVDIHAAIIDLLSKESTFNFVSLLHKEFYDESAPQKLISFFSSQTFNKSSNLLSYHQKNKNIVDIVFEIIKADPKLLFNSIQKISLQLETTGFIDTFSVLRKIWLQLSSDEQLKLLELMRDFMQNDFSLDYILNYWSLFFNKDLSVLSHVNEALWSNQQKTETSVRAILQLLSMVSDQDSLADLIRFFQKDNLITILKMFSSDISPIDVAYALFDSNKMNQQKIAHVENQKDDFKFSSYNVLQLNCLKGLSQFQSTQAGLTQALNVFHDICPGMQESKFFIPRINHALSSNNVIMQRDFNANFLHDIGLFSNNNVNLYLKLILKGNIAFQDIGGIKQVINGASELTRKNYLLEMFKPVFSFAELYLKNAHENWLNRETLIQLWKNVFLSIKSWLSPIHHNLSGLNCRNYAPLEVTRIDCRNNEGKYVTIIKTLEVLGDKENGSQLFQSLINLLDKNQGVKIPFDRKNQISQSIGLKEIFSLIYDLGSEQTLKSVMIKDANGVARKFKLNTIQRLEVVIREISFLDNYYGSHFKNQVASAKNYQEKVKRLFSQVKLMENASKAMVKVGVLPVDAIYRLENIRETYSSLIEAGVDINNRNHALTLQAIIASTVESSEKRAQDFNPYRIPEPERTVHHKGWFLTYFSQLNGLSSLAHIVHKFYPELIKFEEMLQSEKFQMMDQHLLKLASNSSLKYLFEVLTYKQLNRNDKLTNRLIAALLHQLDDLSSQDIEKIFLAITNIAYKISHQLKPLALDSVIKNTEFILSYLVNVLESEHLKLDTRLIDFIYRISQQLLDDKILIKKLFNLTLVLNTSISDLSLSERAKLSFKLADDTVAALVSLTQLLNDYSLATVKDVFSRLDEVFIAQKVLDDLTPIIAKIDHVHMYKLMQFLNENEAERLKGVLDYFFIESLDRINQMIDSTLQSVE